MALAPYIQLCTVSVHKEAERDKCCPLLVALVLVDQRHAEQALLPGIPA